MNPIIHILQLIPGILFSVTIHEYTKAIVSTRLGDPLPKRRGFLTLNPFKHIEPIGFLFFMFLGFGWGKPVDTSAVYYPDRKKGIFMTYTLPLAVNTLLAIIIAMPLYAFKITVLPQLSSFTSAFTADVIRFGYQVVFLVVRCNLAIVLFNLIPVYPLDGSKLLAAVLSPRNNMKMINNQRMIQLVFVLMLVLGVINGIIDPILELLLGFITY